VARAEGPPVGLMIIDADEGRKYDGIGARTPAFSPDGKRVATGQNWAENSSWSWTRKRQDSTIAS